ncbi:hypothetical protein SAMN05444581_11180 [Methylocapsa palsarum]|uniref:Uncharacterized protein n=1 Tax=Methylocapsa palsarum TaxID=1612308 RepID=A0A1I4ATE7_9HYPH|nr:hypothetical protein SAMN05444581_11180 [Methylocapsa palsarum]
MRTPADCALGRLGWPEARAFLKNALRRGPAAAVIDAIAPIADRKCVVLIGRLAKAQTELTAAALEALESIDDRFVRRQSLPAKSALGRVEKTMMKTLRSMPFLDSRVPAAGWGPSFLIAAETMQIARLTSLPDRVLGAGESTEEIQN